jgi:hypothetical protein
VWKTYEELLEYKETVEKQNNLVVSSMYDDVLRLAKKQGRIFVHQHVLNDFTKYRDNY